MLFGCEILLSVTVCWAGSLAQHHACIQYIKHVSSLLGVCHFRSWSVSYVNWRIRYDNTYWIVRTHMYIIRIKLMIPYKSVWSKSERQILYTNTCIWSLKLWYLQNYLQGSSGDTDIETDLWTRARRDGWLDDWREWCGNIHITMCKRESALGTLLCDRASSTQGSVTTWRGGMGGDGMEDQEGVDVCMPVADSCW